MIILIEITRLATVALICYLFFRLQSKNRTIHQTQELWKTYALALEVQLECIRDYYTKIDGEGCMTRSRRRQKDIAQSENAEYLAYDTRDALIELGEYDDEEKSKAAL